MSSAVKVVTWVLLALWAVFTIVFIIKFHNFVQHPLGHNSGGGGGLFLVIGQAALGAAVILIWQLGNREAS